VTSKTNVTDDLRNRLGACESRQQELLAERSEIAYVATVEKQKAAVQRLVAINGELSALTNETSVLESALRESHRRETLAEKQAQAAKRCADARAADALLAEAEDIACRIDAGLTAVSQNSLMFEQKMIEVRRLTGDITPRYDNIRVFLVRALRSAVHRGPLHIDPVAPSDVTTVSQAMASWSRSIRGWIAGVLDKTTAREAA
jgi:hypothetical protein